MKKNFQCCSQCRRNIFFVIICNALIFNKKRKMVNELNIYRCIPQVDLPWLSSPRTETLRKITASLSLLTDQKCPSNNFSHETPQSVSPPFLQGSLMISMIRHCVHVCELRIKLYQVHPILIESKGLISASSTVLRCSLLFLLLKDLRTLITGPRYCVRYFTHREHRNGPCPWNTGQKKGKI